MSCILKPSNDLSTAEIREKFTAKHHGIYESPPLVLAKPRTSQLGYFVVRATIKELFSATKMWSNVVCDDFACVTLFN